MWYSVCLSPEVGEDFASAAIELLQSTFRNLILATGGIYLIWHLAATGGRLRELGLTLPITAVLVLTFALALWLLPRRLLTAQVVWQIGLAAATTLAIHTFRQPTIGFFYSLLPLMAVVTVGWPMGLLSEAFVIALVWWLSYSPATSPLLFSHRIEIIVGGAFTWLLGWAATHTLLTVTRWSLYSFEQAREKMEEARSQRLELKQSREDLIQANRELARLSDRLKAMYQVAEEARQAKEEFVANVSHELRTPLNMIIGFSEIITQSPQVYGDGLPPALLADIEVIERNSRHLAKLVDDVLDLSQIEAGRMALNKEWVSPAEVIDAAALVVRGFFESKGLYLHTEVVADLPMIYCDSTRIRQVVLNLLSNAGRFTERGGVQIRVWREKDRVVVSVADTGPGIAPEDQNRLFEPFQQLDNTIRRRYGGSGLGLSISKQFVEMHGGTMWLESEPGVGTTVYFSLPLEKTSSAIFGDAALRWFSPYTEFEYKERTRPSKAPPPVSIPRLVLLEKGRVLKRLFSRYVDYIETISFEDIEAAIGELNRSPAHALVVNASSFAEMCSLLNRPDDLPHGMPIVTCWVPGEDEAVRRLGIVRYLVKPITRDTLLSTLEELGESVRDVLLVDDDPEVLRLFSRMLSSAERRYRLLRATSGQRALSLLRERRPDVVLLDLVMPEMDGFQLLQAKGQDPAIRDIPVIIISARDPSGAPIVSDRLTVRRRGGLSVRDLLACIQAVSGIPPLSVQSGDRGQPETPAA